MSFWENNKPFRLVLLGGGHTNTQVLLHITSNNVPNNIELIVVSDYNMSLYSGMCPGGVSKQYKQSDFSVNLKEVCKTQGWKFICAKIVEIKGSKNILITADKKEIKYDALCINIGSTNVGNEYPGVSEYAICTRPLILLMDKIDKQEKILISKIAGQLGALKNNENIVVKIYNVGGGCAGCEISMCINNRFTELINSQFPNYKNRIKLECYIITNGKSVLVNEPEPLRNAIIQTLKDMNIKVLTKEKVIKVDENNLHLASKKTLKYDVLFWTTGAKPHKIKTDLKVDQKGWFQCNKYLQSISHSNVFGSGDCINIQEYTNNPAPKAGVYAVRQGPILIHNIQQYLKTDLTTTENKINTETEETKQENNTHTDNPFQFKSYVPQNDFLRLLNTGNGKGVGSKYGLSFEGAWVWKLKDWIDQSWMNKFDPKYILKKGTQLDFKPKTNNNNANQEPLTPKNGAKSLILNDDINEYKSFDIQWKTLVKMNDNNDFKKNVLISLNDIQNSNDMNDDTKV